MDAGRQKKKKRKREREGSTEREAKSGGRGFNPFWACLSRRKEVV